jgi:hypothetical protein
MGTMTREADYWETRCKYCESPLRRDGGCSMWLGEPHDLPYRDRDKERTGRPPLLTGRHPRQDGATFPLHE